MCSSIWAKKRHTTNTCTASVHVHLPKIPVRNNLTGTIQSYIAYTRTCTCTHHPGICSMSCMHVHVSHSFPPHRNRSVELKRSVSLPSPSPPPPPTSPPTQPPHPLNSSSPTRNNHFRHPRKSRRALGPKSLNYHRQNGHNRHSYHRSHSMQENVCNLIKDLDNSFPSLSKCPGKQIHSPVPTPLTPSPGQTYAQATGLPRVSKRTTSERNCFSPTEVPSKRSAVYGVVVTPTALKRGSGHERSEFQPLTEGEEFCSTPQEGGNEDMDTTTPDNNGYSTAHVHVQCMDIKSAVIVVLPLVTAQVEIVVWKFGVAKILRDKYSC